MLQISNLTFGWSESLLFENIDFRLEAGEIVKLAGKNGSGKSTLLQLISGMIPHFQRGHTLKGDIRIEDRSITRFPPGTFFPIISWIPCRHARLFLLNENLEEAFTLAEAVLSMDEQTSDTRNRTLCEYFPEIESMKPIPFQRMAAGEQHKALLMLTYYQGARLYLLDEIFKTVSPETESRIVDFLRHLSNSDCGILLTAHSDKHDFGQTVTIRDRSLC